MLQKSLLLILVASLLLACTPNENKPKDTNSEKTNTPSSKGINVNVIVIKPQVFNKQIVSNGLVKTVRKAELRFKISDRIASIKVKNGQSVQSGQVLAILDNENLLNQLNKVEIDIRKAENKLAEELINFELDTTQEYNSTLLYNLKLKSGLIDAQNAYRNAQIQNSQSILTAPFGGLIANLDIQTGSFISIGDIFCTLIDPKKQEAVFSILENELPFIKKGREVLIQPFSSPNLQSHGIISETNPLVDENGLIQIKAKIRHSNTSFFEGTHVKIISQQVLKNVIVIPKKALVLRSNREVVFTVKKGLAKWNYIDILEENSSSYAISKGLNLMDTIIVSGNLNLSHDARVNTIFVENKE